MDVMRLLRSLEEFLYELVGWLVFHPRTLLRILVHPAGIARYTQRELARPIEQQFAETVSPVLTLILSVVIAHAVELGTHQSVRVGDAPLAKTLAGSDQALLLTRCVVFSTFAFVAALSLMRQRGTVLTRETLREPFSIQAYLVSPFVLLCCAAAVLQRFEPMAGAAAYAASLAWYVWARASAYRALVPVGWPKALGYAAATVGLTALAVLGALALVFADP